MSYDDRINKKLDRIAGLNRNNYDLIITEVDNFLTYLTGIRDSVRDTAELTRINGMIVSFALVKETTEIQKKLKNEIDVRISENNSIREELNKLKKQVNKLDKKSLR